MAKRERVCARPGCTRLARRKSPNGPAPKYCGAACRQRVYEAGLVEKAVAAEAARWLQPSEVPADPAAETDGQESSRDESESRPDSSRGESGSDAGELRERIRAALPPLPPPRSRRHRSSMTASAMPLPLPGLDDEE